MSARPSLTTRRGFIAAAGFGGLSLYGLWSAYGAAPAPLALLGHGADPHEGGADGGHGGAADGPSVDEFRRLTAAFVERYQLPDGSVHPRALAASPAGGTAAPPHGGGASHDGHGQAASAHGAEGPLEVYLLAEKWAYEPGHLRLDAGVPYRFRMLAADVSHGASIQFGRGGRMIRLRPGRVSELEATFTRPGRHLVYCTVFCGEAHDFMQGRLDVA